AWMPRLTRLPAPKRRTWCRVATHVVSALRVRKRLANAPLTQGADAILSPNGKVDEANGEAKAQTARDALRDAVRDLERARSRAGRRNPDKAVEQWKALVDSRWSLVDHFETDGKRYLVARRNDVHVEGYAELSERERQVLAYAALGHTNKLIAYELGLAYSTWRALLFRAAARRGVTRRRALTAKSLGARRVAGTNGAAQ